MNVNPMEVLLDKEHILALLTDEETARVSNVEADYRLTHGDEYVDLDHLDAGLQHARGTVGSLGTLVTKKSVHRDTWSRIVAGLPPTTSTGRPQH